MSTIQPLLPTSSRKLKMTPACSLLFTKLHFDSSPLVVSRLQCLMASLISREWQMRLCMKCVRLWYLVTLLYFVVIKTSHFFATTYRQLKYVIKIRHLPFCSDLSSSRKNWSWKLKPFLKWLIGLAELTRKAIHFQDCLIYYILKWNLASCL